MQCVASRVEIAATATHGAKGRAVMKTRTKVRAGAIALNHNKLKVRTGVKSGALTQNHNKLRVRTGVKSGALSMNHNVVRL